MKALMQQKIDDSDTGITRLQDVVTSVHRHPSRTTGPDLYMTMDEKAAFSASFVARILTQSGYPAASTDYERAVVVLGAGA